MDFTPPSFDAVVKYYRDTNVPDYASIYPAAFRAELERVKIKMQLRDPEVMQLERIYRMESPK